MQGKQEKMSILLYGSSIYTSDTSPFTIFRLEKLLDRDDCTEMLLDTLIIQPCSSTNAILKLSIFRR